MHQHHEESSLRLNSKLDMSWLKDAEQKAAVAVEASNREDQLHNAIICTVCMTIY